MPAMLLMNQLKKRTSKLWLARDDFLCLILASSGIYEIRGQIYLDGRIHEDKIVAGVKCEVYVQVYSCNSCVS